MLDSKVGIYIAGDSTVQNCASSYRPQEGWGKMLPRYFKDYVHVHNYALGGRSTKSFIDEGLLDQILNRIGGWGYTTCSIRSQ